MSVEVKVSKEEHFIPFDIEAAQIDTPTSTYKVKAKKFLEVKRPKRRLMRLMLLPTFVFLYWTSFFWIALIDTLKLYSAGNNIYDAINLDETPQKRNATIEFPRLIHRMWPNDEFLKQDNTEITRNFNRCIDLHKENFTTILWTDVSIKNWMQSHYPQFISTLFDAYPFQIQRVDAARYFILYHHGGVYMDMDIGCFKTKDIGDLVTYMEASGKQVALPQTDPVGLSNDVMFAKKNSQFFKKAIDALPTKNRWFGIHYLTVLYSTGSLYLSLLYFNQKPLERKQIAIIPPRLYSKRGTRYFLHFHGSTWHGKDQWIVRNWFAFLIILFFILLLLLWVRLRPIIRRKQSKLK